MARTMQGTALNLRPGDTFAHPHLPVSYRVHRVGDVTTLDGTETRDLGVSRLDALWLRFPMSQRTSETLTITRGVSS